jgi:hypothetical protein
VCRLSHLLLARAFARWVEAAHQLKALRAKAQQVLRSTLRRRLRSALAVWLLYVEYRETKRAMMAAAERHWRQLYNRHSMMAWSASAKVRTSLQNKFAPRVGIAEGLSSANRQCQCIVIRVCGCAECFDKLM